MEENKVKKSNNILVTIIAVIIALAVGSVTTWFIMNNNNKTDDKKDTQETKKDEKKEVKEDTKEDKKEEEKEEEKKDDEEVVSSKDDYYFSICKLKDKDELVSSVKYYSDENENITSVDLQQATNVIDLDKANDFEYLNDLLSRSKYTCDCAGVECMCKNHNEDGTLKGYIKFNADSSNKVTNLDLSNAVGMIKIGDYKTSSALGDALHEQGYICDTSLNS